MTEQLDITPQVPHDEWAKSELERRRRAAYADPDTGSDRLFIEARRKRKLGMNEDAEILEQLGVERAELIRAEFGYPATEGDDAPEAQE